MGKTQITVIRASAGTGKTYSLTEELRERLASRAVEPEQVIAVTFTRAAAAELKERVRSKLFARGLDEAAQRMETALIGTVHSVCESLLRRFAFESGISPEVEVLPEEEAAACFSEAVSSALTSDRTEEIGRIAARCSVDWIAAAAEVAQKARDNGIGPEALREMAKRSEEGYLKYFLPPAWPTAAAADNAFLSAIAAAIRWIESNRKEGGDETKLTSDFLLELKRMHQKGSRMTWGERASILGMKCGVGSREAAEPVIEMALKQAAHPGLHADVAGLIAAVYGLAADALDRYDRWKKERGLIDFTDMETLTAFTLLKNPSVEKNLRREFKLLMVDEFQDTSPVQLALFQRLGDIAGDVVWVGDRKQSIYKFRGCDPDLMEDAYSALKDTAKERVLDACYRSRAPLVDFCSAVFARTFVPLGYRREEFRLAAPRGNPPGLPSPVEVWSLESKNAETDALLIAEGVRRLLDPREKITVEDRVTGKPRPVRPNDIAILRSTNDQCEAISRVLGNIGIPASVAQGGLTSTPEGVYVISSLEVVLDRSAALPALLIQSLSGRAKMEELIDERIDKAAKPEEKGGDFPWPDDPVLRGLRALADELPFHSPAAMLDRVIETSGAREVCLRWPHSSLALANLDMLRTYALQYEEICRFREAGASTLGLLLYLQSMDQLEEGNKQSAEEYEGAVTVSTYHKAKGREWPIVILGDLDRKERGGCACCGIHVLTGGKGFDLSDPLRGRYIRYWPWPFGDKSRNTPLFEALSRSPEEADARQRDNRESQRILYVGFTRARDILVLPTRRKKPLPAWIERLEADLIFPVEGVEGVAVRDFGGGTMVDSRLRCLDTVSSGDPRKEDKPVWFRRPSGEAPQHQPLFVHPSELHRTGESDKEKQLFREIDLGRAISVKIPEESGSLSIGNTVHGFLAADRRTLGKDKRLKIAQRILSANGITGALLPENLLIMADRLYGYLDKNLPGSKIWREMPLMAHRGDQIVRGVADLVAESDQGFALVDYKAFAWERERCAQIAPTYLPQINAYADALSSALGKPCVMKAIYFPFAGLLLSSPV